MSSAWGSEPLIDLGEVAGIAAASRTSTRSPALRWFRLALAMCAVVLLATSSAGPAPLDGLRLIARVPVGVDASVMIDGSDIYVYDIADGHHGVMAYALDRGGLRWSAATSEFGADTTMDYIDGRVIVSTIGADSGGGRTVALDARTGERLWTSDLGNAIAAAGWVLVTSTPSTGPGDATGSFRLIDARTGQVRWSLRVPVNCAAEVASPSGGVPSVLIELCPRSSRLTEMDLSDGRTVAARTVDLGDPAPSDQMVIAGDTIVIAHANAPTPTIDAYAMSDLHQRWTGLPILDGQDIGACGIDLCVSGGPIFDPHTGKRVGRATFRDPATPGPGPMVLVPVGTTDPPSNAVAIPTIAADVSGRLPPALVLNPPAPAGSAMVLDSWRITSPGHARPAAVAAPTEILNDLDATSCVDVATYLACTTAVDVLSLWKPR
jgi:putative pyrroloquinoline-quinone binding quinoprotein